MEYSVERFGLWRWHVMRHDPAIRMTTAVLPGVWWFRRSRAVIAAQALHAAWWDGYGLGLVAGAPGYHDGPPGSRDPGADL
jgi:hypothetical protein